MLLNSDFEKKVIGKKIGESLGFEYRFCHFDLMSHQEVFHLISKSFMAVNKGAYHVNIKPRAHTCFLICWVIQT